MAILSKDKRQSDRQPQNKGKVKVLDSTHLGTIGEKTNFVPSALDQD